MWYEIMYRKRRNWKRRSRKRKNKKRSWRIWIFCIVCIWMIHIISCFIVMLHIKMEIKVISLRINFCLRLDRLTTNAQNLYMWPTFCLKSQLYSHSNSSLLWELELHLRCYCSSHCLLSTVANFSPFVIVFDFKSMESSCWWCM